MTMTPTNADDRPGGEPKQYLTFALCGEDFGIEILRVQEIKCMARITPIPNTPRHVKGVLNLRGTVVPVVDLRAKFGLGEVEYNRFTVIIVVNVGRRVLGLVVDAVSDVLNLGDGDVQPPPELGGDLDLSFVTGMARSGDRLITLLDIDRLVGQEAATTPAAAPAALVTEPAAMTT
jgi:purine-binding chemotaxis protein CheW